jgi:hypothetical protein
MRKSVRKLVKEFLLKISVSVLLGTVGYFLFKSIVIALAIVFVLLVILLIKPGLKICYYFLARSKRFQMYFDFLKFRAVPRQLEVVNLGSSSAKYAFDYTGLMHGMNFALAPQTMRYDFSILKNYHSYIKPGGVVLIPLCPFTWCVGENFQNPKDDVKYYALLHPAVIYDYDFAIGRKISTGKPNLIYMAIKRLSLKSLFTFLLSLIRPHRSMLSNNPLKGEALVRDAEIRIKNWMKQFDISDLYSECVSENNQRAITYNIELLVDIVNFCLERDYKPVIVLPPATKALQSKIPVVFRELYIYSLLNDDVLKNILFLNYFDNEQFLDDNLFFNSFFLNSRGSKLFTKQIIADIFGRE